VAQGGEAYTKARAAALTALKLDEKLAEAYIPLAVVKFYHDWNWAGAEQDYRRAIELRPDYPTAHQRYSLALMWLGRFEQAQAEIQRARELDPASLVINTNAGEVLLRWRRYEQAVEAARKVLELEASYALAHVHIAQAFVQLGRYDEAIADLKTSLPRSGANGLGRLGHAYGVAGRRAEALSLLKDLLELQGIVGNHPESH